MSLIKNKRYIWTSNTFVTAQYYLELKIEDETFALNVEKHVSCLGYDSD